MHIGPANGPLAFGDAANVAKIRSLSRAARSSIQCCAVAVLKSKYSDLTVTVTYYAHLRAEIFGGNLLSNGTMTPVNGRGAWSPDTNPDGFCKKIFENSR